MKPNVFSGPFLLKLFKEAGGEWLKDNAMRLSAALSYYSIFSLAPLLLIAIAIAGWFFEKDAANGQIEAQLTSLVGWQVAQALQSVVKSANGDGGGPSLVGFITLFIGASAVFGQLKDALNTIWEVRPKSSGIMAFVKERLLSFGIVLAIGFLLLVSLIVAAVATGMSGWLEAHLGLPKFLTAVIGFVLPLGVETVLFALLFKVLPDAEIEWRSVWFGGALTAILFELGKLGLSLYLTKATPDSAFGAAGSVVILLVWVYYASMILFFGAEVTEVYARLQGHEIQPSANAESTELACPGGAQPVPASAVKPTVDPSPLSPDARPPQVPERETLAPMIARNLVPDPEVRRRIEEEAALARTPAGFLKVWLKRADDHPVAELAAAVGVGVLAGIVSRLMEQKEISAADHFRLGAKEVKENLRFSAIETAEDLRDRAKDVVHDGESLARRLGESLAGAFAKARG